MRLLQVYNNYRSGGGGETVVVRQTKDILHKHGHSVRMLARDSRTIVTLRHKLEAFANGLYSWEAKREISDIIEKDRPNVVHVHNLYPFFSPSVLVACRQQSVPVVMTLHNYALTCPELRHLRAGAVCERCLGGREHWCVLHNCRDNIFESVGYALRAAASRKLRLFVENVTLFIALTNFAKHRLLNAGFEDNHIVVIPNAVSLPESAVDPSTGAYAAFVGRLSPEKGISTLLIAARRTGLPLRIAGDGPMSPLLVRQAPKNVEFVGKLDRMAIRTFYRSARFIVVPSQWFEGFPLVIAEAMSHGIPVIASKIGGLPEIVEDGVTGILSEPGNAEDLAAKMQMLWENPDLCRQMGRAGRQKVMREYTEDTYFQNLMAVYQTAIQRSLNRAVVTPLVHIDNAVLPSNGTGKSFGKG
jgi:glycosyltransferase involved in cell wall biosynthesis